MLRKLLAVAGLSLAAGLGCSMCQDCLDQTGTVPDAPNFGDYDHSPRVGSAQVQVASDMPPLAPGEEYVEGSVEYSE